MEQELRREEPKRAVPARVPAVSAAAPRSRVRRVVRWIKLVALAVLVIGLTYLSIAPTGRYLVRAGWEEGKILARRHSITDLVADSSMSPRVRSKLQLVLAARGFAVDSVKLRARESFTTFSQLQHDTLVLVLSGAY